MINAVSFFEPHFSSIPISQSERSFYLKYAPISGIPAPARFPASAEVWTRGAFAPVSLPAPPVGKRYSAGKVRGPGEGVDERRLLTEPEPVSHEGIVTFRPERREFVRAASTQGGEGGPMLTGTKFPRASAAFRARGYTLSGTALRF